MDQKRNKEYWNRRVLVDKAKIINNAEDFLRRNQKDLYGKAEKEIQTEVEKLYRKFADQQKITLAEARQLIRDADFRKIDWQGMIKESLDLREQIRNEKGNLPDEIIAALEEQHKKLEARMAAYTKRGQISQLELRQIEIDRKLLSLYDDQQKNIYDYLHSEYDDGYYRQIYNTQQRVGFGHDFVHPNEAAIDKAILNQYQRQNFSKTLYQHCDHFSKDLRENLVTGMIRGENLDKMASRIHKRMGVACSAARRLVRTETAYIYEQATKDAYEQCDIEYYEYMAALDNKTSEMCRKLDGKHFKVKDALPGKNYPPMHPNCRSTTVCWFPDEKNKKEQTTRLAKDEDGKYYEVPADMNYRQWQKKYGPDAEDDSRRREKRRKWDEKHDMKKPIGMYGIPHAREIRELVEHNTTPAARLLLKYYDQVKVINTEARGGAVYVHHRKAIRYNVKKDISDDRGRHTALFHEVGHMVDDLMGKPSHLKIFRDAIQQDSDNLFRALIDGGVCANMEEAYKYVNRKTENDPSYHVVRDVLRGTTGNKIGAENRRHDVDYWKKPGRIESETFAHFFEASLVDNPEKLQSIQQTFPHAWEVYEEIVKSGL